MARKRVLVNCIHLLDGESGAGGAGSYVHGLLDHLPSMMDIEVLAGQENRAQLEAHAGCSVVVPDGGGYDQIRHRLDQADVYLSPLNGITPEFLDSRIPIATTLLDLQHAVMPWLFSADTLAQRHRVYGLSAARADAILTISEFERCNIQKLYGTRKVHVTYLTGYLADAMENRLPEDPSITIAEHADWIEDGPTLLYPAIPWPHKNHVRLIQAVAMLRRHAAFRNLRLVLTGSQDHSMVRRLYRDLLDALGLSHAVRHFGFLNPGDLAWLFRKASLVAFPSLYEGFGIPVVDAMKFARPVIATRRTAIPEVGGEAIAYFRNPFDARTMAEDIGTLLGDSNRLAILAGAGPSAAARFSARATAEATNRALDAACTARTEAAIPEVRGLPDRATLVPRCVVSMLVDTTLVPMDALHPAVEAFWQASGPHTDTIDFIGLFTEGAQAATLERWAAAGGAVAFVTAETQDSPEIELRFLRDEVARGELLLYVRLELFNPRVFRELGYAAALMQSNLALSGTLFDARASVLRVLGPLGEREVAEAYSAARKDPGAFHHNRMVRRSDSHGARFPLLAGIVDQLKQPAMLQLPISVQT